MIQSHSSMTRLLQRIHGATHLAHAHAHVCARYMSTVGTIAWPHQRQGRVEVGQQRRQHAQHAAQRAQHDQPHEQAAVLQRPGQHALRQNRKGSRSLQLQVRTTTFGCCCAARAHECGLACACLRFCLD